MVFMMEKGFIAIIFMYSLSFSLFGGQYVFGDVFGVQLTNFQGQPIVNDLLPVVNLHGFNQVGANVTSTSLGQVQSNPLVRAASAGFELFQLATGTYILNVMLFFGIPLPFVYGISGLMSLLVIRMFIGLVKEFI